MKNLLFVLLISATVINAQFTNNDYSLVKTTYERDFDTKVIKEYLDSDSQNKVKAALLSISHSGDSKWFNEIANLDFKKYGPYSAFALGQIGPSQEASEYLLDKIKLYKSTEAFRAIGKTGNVNDLDTLLEWAGEEYNPEFRGLAYSIFEFSARSINEPDKARKTKRFLTNMLESGNDDEKFEALFVLYRIGSTKEAFKAIVNALSLPDEPAFVKHKTYALANLRTVSLVPNDVNTMEILLNNQDWRIRVEALKAFAGYKFSSPDELNIYLALLKDINPNAARQCAVSAKNMNVVDSLKPLFLAKLKNLLKDDLTDNARGELFISFASVSETNKLDLIKESVKNVEKDFLFRTISLASGNATEAFRFLQNNKSGLSPKAELSRISALLSIQKDLQENEEFTNELLNTLKGNNPAAAAIIADGIDSAFIAINNDKLLKITGELIKQRKDDADFIETLGSLRRLSKKISNDFYKEMLQELYSSNMLVITSEAAKELGKKAVVKKDEKLFEKFWQRAFKYKGAEVITEKGRFSFDFSPEAAAVTVGNFAYLAEQGYFNGVIFHRVVPNFVIQTGDPTGTGWGGPGYDIISEFSKRPYDTGYVGMASAGKDTEGSQWFVMHNYYPHLDWRYTNFGIITSGMDTVFNIDEGDKIREIKLIPR